MAQSLYDLYMEHLMMKSVDPRPINGGIRAEGFIKYLLESGYLPDDMDERELEHLAVKFDIFVREAVYADRKDRFMNSDKQ